MRIIKKKLDINEKEFRDRQKRKMQDIIAAGHDQKLKIQEKNQALLVLCKSWNGPILTMADFDLAKAIVLQQNIPLKKFLKTEISFRKMTNPREVVENADLFRLNKLSVEMLETNFKKLLSIKYLELKEMPEDVEIINIIKNISKNQ